MAHIKKFTSAFCRRVLSHNLKHMNRNLHQIPLNPIDYLDERLAQVKVQKRADVNVMCSWIVTVPKDLPVEKHDEFFESVYRFLSKDVGEENVVMASVHLDMTTPHLRFCFIPVVKERKNQKKLGQEKVSAHELVNRNYLRAFHGRLQKHVEAELGCQVKVVLPEEERKLARPYVTLKELKRRTKSKINPGDTQGNHLSN